MMHWDSPESFLHMGGYAFYVWASYGVCALAIAAEIVSARARKRRAEAAIRRLAGTGRTVA